MHTTESGNPRKLCKTLPPYRIKTPTELSLRAGVVDPEDSTTMKAEFSTAMCSITRLVTQCSRCSHLSGYGYRYD